MLKLPEGKTKTKGLSKMKKTEKRILITGLILITLFIALTAVVLTVDVQPAGQKGTDIGLSSVNCRFHELTGVNMTLYTVTDWAGLVPIAVCFFFGLLGLFQLIKRKNLLQVDCDILILGIYYIAVIAGYVIFEMIPINYRPVLINGILFATT